MAKDPLKRALGAMAKLTKYAEGGLVSRKIVTMTTAMDQIASCSLKCARRPSSQCGTETVQAAPVVAVMMIMTMTIPLFPPI
jgi:hypothetical protein